MQVVEHREHVAVLSGNKKIEDMLVFLAYRRLLHVLEKGRGGEQHGQDL